MEMCTNLLLYINTVMPRHLTVLSNRLVYTFYLLVRMIYDESIHRILRTPGNPGRGEHKDTIFLLVADLVPDILHLQKRTFSFVSHGDGPWHLAYGMEK